MHERGPHLPLAGSRFLFEQQALDRAAARHAMSDQSRGEDTRVVRDEQIARTQKPGQRGNCRVFDSGPGTIEDEQAGRAARDRFLRDQLWRKGEIEIARVHVAYNHPRCPTHL
jgi:hypothetical protein